MQLVSINAEMCGYKNIRLLLSGCVIRHPDYCDDAEVALPPQIDDDAIACTNWTTLKPSPKTTFTLLTPHLLTIYNTHTHIHTDQINHEGFSHAEWKYHAWIWFGHLEI
jgi:hypothetical protein